jgi:hypothetical protein
VRTMSERRKPGRTAGVPRTARRCLLLALAALAACAAAAGAATKTQTPERPTAVTGSASKFRGTSATLLGSVDPGGLSTTYYFQYGPTIAYGKVTPTATLAAGYAKVAVGKAVAGIATGYHYRLVASNADGASFGRDRTVGSKKRSTATFKVLKTTEPTPYGGTYVLSGTLGGAGNANRAIVLQASPFPFLEPFTSVGIASHTDAAGRFSFRVANMTKSTQFRVSTLDPRPLYSHIVTQHVAVRVTMKVRSSGHPGLVRVYGTVTPAEPGARLELQLFKRVRPGSSPKAEEKETGTKFVTQFTTHVKKGTKTVSRYSLVADVRRGGSYRAYVNLSGKGVLVSGWSRPTLLHSDPSLSRTRR